VHVDLSILGSELDGVVKEVSENLLQSIRITGEVDKRVHYRLKANAFCFGC
jgi:hypothetical protein